MESSDDEGGEKLCPCYFTYCDTSFKMASENRSLHEYGDINIATSISDFVTTASVALSETEESDLHSNNVSTGNFSYAKSSISSSVDKKSTFEAAIASQMGDCNPHTKELPHKSSHKHSLVDSTKPSINSDIDLVSLKSKTNSENARKIISSTDVKKLAEEGKFLSATNTGNTPVLNTGASKKKRPGSYYSSDSDSDLSCDIGHDKVETDNGHKHVSAPHVNSYLSEKDKFMMALNGDSNNNNDTSGIDTNGFNHDLNGAATTYTVHHSSKFTNNNSSTSVNSYSSPVSLKNKFDQALQKQTQAQPSAFTSSKALFDAAVSSGSQPQMQQETSNGKDDISAFYDHRTQNGLTADVVGNHLMGSEHNM